MTNEQTNQLTKAIANLIRLSAKNDRIFDNSYAVTINSDNGSIKCSKIHESDEETILLTTDDIISYVGVTPDSEALAASHPELVASQYIEARYWDIDAAIDDLILGHDSSDETNKEI